MASSLGDITLSVLLIVLLKASGCAGRDFAVTGGPGGGWTTNPSVPLDHFQINDTLDFKYDKDVDAVLWVNQSQYDVCNTTGPPLLSLTGGESIFVLGNSGHYYFLSSDATRCHAGERLGVVVPAVHDNATSAPPPNPASSSSAPPPPPPKAPASPPPTDSASSSSPPPPPPPKPASPPPPASASSSSAPPPPPPFPCPTATASVSPPPPPPNPSAENGASSPAPAPVTAPVPGTKYGTFPPPTSSSAVVALRAGVLACLVIGATAAIL